MTTPIQRKIYKLDRQCTDEEIERIAAAKSSTFRELTEFDALAVWNHKTIENYECCETGEEGVMREQFNL